MHIIEKYNARVDKVNSLLCVGLDSDISHIPGEFASKEEPQFAFNRFIIEQTHEYASSYKINTAFYEARGSQGFAELKKTVDYLAQEYPDIVTICDAKRGDIGSTSEAYARAVFDYFGFDAVTLNPYLGKDALLPFLERKDKGSIILCRTSNPDAGEFQDLLVGDKPLWQVVAERVLQDWNAKGNCLLVVGATYPEEMKTIRSIAPDIPFLVPGIGTQGGNAKEVVVNGLDRQGKGLLIHSARGIIFSEQPKERARALRDEINQYR